MMKVYHTKDWSLNSDFHFAGSEELCPQWKDGYKPIPANYQLVGEVETDDKERAYMLTNHIDTEWWNNDGVKKVIAKEVRSTSMGDLLEDENGQLWVVASIGFEKIEWHHGPFKHYDNGREGKYLVHLTADDEKMLERFQGLVNELAEDPDNEFLHKIVAAGRRHLRKIGLMI